MCDGCWREYGAPSIVSERARRAAKLIAVVYDHSPTGGHAHIVVDDWNLEDEHLRSAMELVRQNYFKSTDDALQAEQEFLEAMQAMSIAERASALALFEGFVPENRVARRGGK